MKRILKSIITVSLLAGLAVGMSGCNPDEIDSYYGAF